LVLSLRSPTFVSEIYAFQMLGFAAQPTSWRIYVLPYLARFVEEYQNRKEGGRLRFFWECRRRRFMAEK